MPEAASLGATDALDFTGGDTAHLVVDNAGANTLDGKCGNHVLVGLGGADTFAFTSALGAGNVDTIEGFVSGSDRIGLDDAIFTALAAGALAAGAFVARHRGAAMRTTGSSTISATGALLYDADGNGAGAAVQFATVAGAPVLAASDFTVI